MSSVMSANCVLSVVFIKRILYCIELYCTYFMGRPHALNCDVRDDNADIITHARFCDSRFRGFGVLIPPLLPFCIGFATELHCDKIT